MFFDEAISFINKNKENPFLCFLSLNAHIVRLMFQKNITNCMKMKVIYWKVKKDFME